MADVNISKYRASVVRDGSKPASPGFVVSEGQDPVNPPGTNNFVPYTGATANVELGEFGVEAGFVTLDTTPTNIPTDQGAIYWDDTRSTAALIMNGTLQHIGQDSFFYVKNSSGSTIPKGTCVGFAGTDGGSGHLLVTPFLANGSVPSTYFMGVTAEAIANGSFGQVMHFGELEGINTSGFTAGALLYASTTVAGGFQTTVPVAPNNIILVAAAVNSKNNGAIVVRPTLGSNINSDEGVKITSPTTGDLLQLQAGGLWENKTLAQVIGSAYVPSTRTLTINGTAFDLSANRSWTVGDVRTDGSYSNPSWITALAWSKITGTPTTLSGYGITDAVPSSRTITINGVTQDLSANRTFNVGTVTSVGLSSATSGVTIGSTPVTSSGTITLAIATASGSQQGLLSASDWTTFNNKQNALTNPVTGTGTTNYLAKFTGSTTVGNSQIFDNGTNVGINQTSPTRTLDILGASGIGTVLKLQGASGTTTYLQLAYNGATNSQSGYIGYNSSSQMQFFTNDTLALTIDSNRNLGLGVTPSAWASDFRAMQIGLGTSLYNNGNTNGTFLGSNFFFNGSNNIYIGTGTATAYAQSLGTHAWYTAPSGTAGNAISFTQAMTLTSGGNLLVGTTTDNGAKLQVSGNLYISRSSNPYLTIDDTGVNSEGGILFKPSGFNSKGGLTINYSTAEQRLFVGEGGNSYFQTFYTNGSERLRITSSGNLGLGVTPSAWGSLFNNSLLQVKTTSMLGFDNNLYLGVNYYATNLSDNYIQNGFASRYVQRIGQHQWETAPSGTANGAVSFTQAMTLTSGGNLLVGTTTDNGAKLQVNGSMTVGSITGDRCFIGQVPSYGPDFTQFSHISRAGANQYSFLSGNAGDTYINSVNAQPIYFRHNNVNLAIITSNGNVGIGTTSPERDSGTRSLAISGSSSLAASLDLYGNARNFAIFTGGAGSLGFFDLTGGAQRMTITSGGNVLIGTTTDSGARLQVSGIVNSRSASTSAGLGQVAFIGSGEFMSTGSLSGYFWENRSGGVTSNSNWYGWYTTSGVINLWNGGGNLLSINGTSGAATFSSSVTANGTATFLGQFGNGNNVNEKVLQFLRASASTDIVNIQGINAGVGAANIAMQALGGNVGIGTSSPSSPLQVRGQSSVPQNGIFLSTNTFTLLSTGSLLRLGHIASSGDTTAIIENLTQGGQAAGNIAFPTGNVLIGTTTDVGARLHVNGDVRTAAPTGGSAVNWRLGTVRGGTVTPNATVRVEIGGVLVDLDARYV